MFAREGTALILGALALAVVLALPGLFWGRGWWALAVLGAVLFGLVLWFFRDPKRTPPAGADGLLLAPADGRVVEVVTEFEPLYLQAEAQRVSIFLSPLNVHVNRIPATGTVEFERYVPGEYLVAWHPKASEKNERSEIGLLHASGTRVLFKQIAGAVARRIVYYPRVGEAWQAGQRFGLVKFGSRMDVVVPPGIPLSVRVGDRVVAGETVIGRLPGAVADSTASARQAAPAEAR